MEDMKSNIEKIFDQYADSIADGVPKRLSFNLNDEPFANFNVKKRKNSLEINGSSEKKIREEKPLNNSLTIDTTFNSSMIGDSPWQARRLKADLLDAKSQITQLKQEVTHQNKIRNEMEILYKSKTDSLQLQLNHSTTKISDLEKHLSVIRKREATNREELTKTKNEMASNKQMYDEKFYKINKENHELNDKLRYQQNELSNKIGDLQRKLMEAEKNLQAEQDQNEELNDLYCELQDKAQQFDELDKQLTMERSKTQKLQSKISELEYELSSYGEWKNISKTSQVKLSSMSEMDKEIARLKQENANLRDTVGNKLILEEQVYDLKTRLESSDKHNSEVVVVKAQVVAMEQEIKNWKSVAIDHCLPNTQPTPLNLRCRLEALLQKDLLFTCEQSNMTTEKKTLQEQLTEFKEQAEIYQKNNNELKGVLKRLQSIIQKIQKKLIIVAGERDAYKLLLDNYEKDLTITGNQTQNSPESQIRIRMDMLEQTAANYKELCASLEKELQNRSPEINIDSINNENYERLRIELTKLRSEFDKMKRRKEELELEMEHRSLKGDFNLEKFKVLHLQLNPANEAYDSYKNEVEKLQVEIERLRRRIRKLEENEQEMTSRLNETTNVTVNVQELNSLRTQVQNLEAKNQHMKEIYRAASQEFRDVCYMLFGYRVDRINNNMYRVSSMYAETPEEYLNFRINESGVLDMLESTYSTALSDMMHQHLGAHNSLPAFLSTLTLELFNKTTLMSIK